MTALPDDVALAVATAGIDAHLPDEEFAAVLRFAIADRGGYLSGPTIGEIGWTVQLLAPARLTFAGRTPNLSLAWCLVVLMGERDAVTILEHYS